MDRPTWPRHRPWLILCVLVTLAALAWFGVESHGRSDWPGGSSLPGFTFGVLGGLIIVFEFLLWPRKKVRVWPIGSARLWLRAHIWLGLLSVPLLILHSGLRLGGTLSTVLMILFLVVIASGIWGLVLQNLLPRQMLDVPAESFYSQRDFLVTQLLGEADRLMTATCGTPTETTDAIEMGRTVVSAVRFQGVQVPAAPITEAEPLALFYREQVAPFLRSGTAGDSSLASASRAAVLFRNVKLQIAPAAHEVADLLAGFCEQRRLWDRQARLHFWLHNWLWLHLPLSVLLVCLMLVHVYMALKYW
jgi:hypothetical protein